MLKVTMAVSLLLVSAAAAASTDSGIEMNATRSAVSEHSLVRFDAAQTLAFAGKNKPAAKAEEPKAAEPAKTETAVNADEYKPKTQFDNTPYRFNMHQNGKKMTADEFDAWMKSRGFRVAKGKAPAAGAAPAAAGTEVAAEAKSK